MFLQRRSVCRRQSIVKGSKEAESVFNLGKIYDSQGTPQANSEAESTAPQRCSTAQGLVVVRGFRMNSPRRMWGVENGKATPRCRYITENQPCSPAQKAALHTSISAGTIQALTSPQSQVTVCHAPLGHSHMSANVKAALTKGLLKTTSPRPPNTKCYNAVSFHLCIYTRQAMDSLIRSPGIG